MGVYAAPLLGPQLERFIIEDSRFTGVPEPLCHSDSAAIWGHLTPGLGVDRRPLRGIWLSSSTHLLAA